MRLAESIRDWESLIDMNHDPFEELRRGARRVRLVTNWSAKSDMLRWWTATTEELLHEHRPWELSKEPRQLGLAQRFAEKKDRWMWSNLSVSNASTLLQDPDFLAIVGMGRDGIPFVLHELADSRNPLWLHALPAMAEENPAATSKSVDEAISQWLRWGESRGLI